jgi:hypothetical protein
MNRGQRDELLIAEILAVGDRFACMRSMMMRASGYPASFRAYHVTCVQVV